MCECAEGKGGGFVPKELGFCVGREWGLGKAGSMEGKLGSKNLEVSE